MDHGGNYLQNAQNLIDNNLHIAIGDGAGEAIVGVCGGANDEVGRGEHVVVGGGKFDDERDHDHDEELKYNIKEVQQTEKLQKDGVDQLSMGNGNGNGNGNDFGDGKDFYLHEFGHQLQQQQQHEHDFNPFEKDVGGDFSTTFNPVSALCEDLIESADLQHDDHDEGSRHDDESSLATNGTSSLSENVPQLLQQQEQQTINDKVAFTFTEDEATADKENADPVIVAATRNAEALLASDSLGSPDLELESHYQLNPDAKPFVPTFGSSPTTPTSPHAAIDGIDFASGSSNVEAELPNALPRHMLDAGISNFDDVVAQSPRKGRCADMDTIALPQTDMEFEDEADKRPHEDDDDFVSVGQQNGDGDLVSEAALCVPSDSNTDTELLEVNYRNGSELHEHGPETSVDIVQGLAESANDQLEVQTPYRDEIGILLNTVQVLPVDSDSDFNSSFVENDQTPSIQQCELVQQELEEEREFEQADPDESLLKKEMLNVEEKEHLSHVSSPSTEEVVDILGEQFNVSAATANTAAVSDSVNLNDVNNLMDTAGHMQDSFYMENTSSDAHKMDEENVADEKISNDYYNNPFGDGSTDAAFEDYKIGSGNDDVIHNIPTIGEVSDFSATANCYEEEQLQQRSEQQQQQQQEQQQIQTAAAAHSYENDIPSPFSAIEKHTMEDTKEHIALDDPARWVADIAADADDFERKMDMLSFEQMQTQPMAPPIAAVGHENQFEDQHDIVTPEPELVSQPQQEIEHDREPEQQELINVEQFITEPEYANEIGKLIASEHVEEHQQEQEPEQEQTLPVVDEEIQQSRNASEMEAVVTVPIADFTTSATVEAPAIAADLSSSSLTDDIVGVSSVASEAIPTIVEIAQETEAPAVMPVAAAATAAAAAAIAIAAAAVAGTAAVAPAAVATTAAKKTEPSKKKTTTTAATAKPKAGASEAITKKAPIAAAKKPDTVTRTAITKTTTAAPRPRTAPVKTPAVPAPRTVSAKMTTTTTTAAAAATKTTATRPSTAPSTLAASNKKPLTSTTTTASSTASARSLSTRPATVSTARPAPIARPSARKTPGTEAATNGTAKPSNGTTPTKPTTLGLSTTAAAKPRLSPRSVPPISKPGAANGGTIAATKSPLKTSTTATAGKSTTAPRPFTARPAPKSSSSSSTTTTTTTTTTTRRVTLGSSSVSATKTSMTGSNPAPIRKSATPTKPSSTTTTLSSIGSKSSALKSTSATGSSLKPKIKATTTTGKASSTALKGRTSIGASAGASVPKTNGNAAAVNHKNLNGGAGGGAGDGNVEIAGDNIVQHAVGLDQNGGDAIPVATEAALIDA